jgi:hypothetical protein
MTACVQAFLKSSFLELWIGRVWPQAWPSRLPDLNPIDFFLWRQVKNMARSTGQRRTLEKILKSLAGIRVEVLVLGSVH